MDRVYTAAETWGMPAVPLTPDTRVKCDGEQCTWSGAMRDTAFRGGNRVCPACERRAFRARGEGGGMVKIKLEWFQPAHGASFLWVTRVPCVGELVYARTPSFGDLPPSPMVNARVKEVLHFGAASDMGNGYGMIACCEIAWEKQEDESL